MEWKNTMRIFAAAVIAVGMLAFVSGCGKKDSTVVPSSESKKLVMVTEATFPPYEYMENSKIVGIDPEIVGEIARNLGYKLVIQDMKFDSVILAVQTGKADIAASGITVTADRKKQVNFTVPYVTAAQVIIIPKKSSIKTPTDLKGKRIGVQQGTTGDTYVRKHICEPERYDNGALAVAALRAGKVDAVVLDGEPSKVHVQQYPNEIMLLPVALTQEEYAFALNKKNTKLLKAFNSELVRMRASGRLQQILDKYLNKK